MSEHAVALRAKYVNELNQCSARISALMQQLDTEKQRKEQLHGAVFGLESLLSAEAAAAEAANKTAAAPLPAQVTAAEASSSQA